MLRSLVGSEMCIRDRCWDRAVNFGAGLVHLGCCSPNPDGLKLLGFYAKNRPEWFYGENGCYMQSIAPVPLYDTLGVESIGYVINQTSLGACVCSKEVIENVLAVCDMPGNTLKTIIQMEADIAPAHQQRADAAGVKIIGFQEVERIGASQPTPIQAPCGKDLAFFCYTSGTTGDSKGAMITHENFITCMAGCRAVGLDMFADDVHLSYLPLPHVFERAIQVSVVFGGGCIGFYQGDTLKILEDLAALRPTIFPSVPRLLNRVHDKILAGVEEAGGIKAMLFKQALAAKTGYLAAGNDAAALKHMVWDTLVFGPLKKRLGFDRLRLICTGSAPISGTVMNFLRAVFGVPVLEGYGQTESSTCISLTSAYDFSLGHVGGPMPCNEVRLDDVPDMGYLQSDTVHDSKKGSPEPCMGRGEIVFRGPNVFQGYYHMDDKTREAVDEDGWCYTGDIGLWTPDGKLKIIDRKKNIFKLSQGEYVAAEKIENLLTQSPFLAQCFVYGDSLQAVLVAIVVPNVEHLEPWAKAKGIKFGSFAELCSLPEVKKAILDSMTSQGKKAQLKGFEMIKAIHLEPEEFSAANGILTPTFKLKRNIAKDRYQDKIDEMYDAINAAPKSKM
eukprot:TRINITY_DN25853_c0_g2_i1.p1 TRINITY_DN25853_c0_g2~~TRINITY_DN25853_c0_g2_i1.p1  ORF type:complete len:653 (+),score=193.98 TRINITY_DN25853_c0_g2_i1:116-1960(+)